VKNHTYKIADIKHGREVMAREIMDRKGPITVTFSSKINRSLAQNNNLHRIICQVAKQKGESPEGEKCYFKLTFCVPILRSDAEFEDFYKKAMLRDTYEKKINAMRYISASSLLSKKQMTEAIDAYVTECANNHISVSMPGDGEGW